MRTPVRLAIRTFLVTNFGSPFFVQDPHAKHCLPEAELDKAVRYPELEGFAKKLIEEPYLLDGVDAIPNLEVWGTNAFAFDTDTNKTVPAVAYYVVFPTTHVGWSYGQHPDRFKIRQKHLSRFDEDDLDYYLFDSDGSIITDMDNAINLEENGWLIFS